MQRFFYKFCILVCFLASHNMTGYAKKIPGFIITKESDTLLGTVKLHNYNFNNEGWLINGIDLEFFYSQVDFKEEKTTKFITFIPDELLGFGFVYDSMNYLFQSFSIQSKSISKKGRVKNKFLNLIYKGEYSLYRNLDRRRNDFNSQRTGIFSTLFSDYYIFNKATGLVKVELTNEFPNYNVLLVHCGLNAKFVNVLPSINNINDLQLVLVLYDYWLNY